MKTQKWKIQFYNLGKMPNTKISFQKLCSSDNEFDILRAPLLSRLPSVRRRERRPQSAGPLHHEGDHLPPPAAAHTDHQSDPGQLSHPRPSQGRQGYCHWPGGYTRVSLFASRNIGLLSHQRQCIYVSINKYNDMWLNISYDMTVIVINVIWLFSYLEI